MLLSALVGMQTVHAESAAAADNMLHYPLGACADALGLSDAKHYSFSCLHEQLAASPGLIMGQCMCRH